MPSQELNLQSSGQLSIRPPVHTDITYSAGMYKVQEWGAPLPENDKKNLGNHHTDEAGI